MQFPPVRKLRRFWKGRILRLWQKQPSLNRIFISIGTILVIALMASFPAYSLVRKWRIGRNSDAAMVAAKANDDLKARDLAMSVILGGDKRIEMLRILERSMSRLGDPRHFQIANRLVHHPQCTTEDRLNVFRNVVHTMPYGQVMMVWLTLPENERRQVPFIVALADRMIDRGGFNDAIRLLEDMREGRDDREVSIRMIRALISRNSKESCQAAQNLMAALGKASPDIKLDWLELAEFIPVAYLDDWVFGPMVSKMSAGIPSAPGRGELLAERIRWVGGNANQRQSIVTVAVARWREKAPAALAAFLIAVGQHELVLTQMSDAAAADIEVFRTRLKSQIHLGLHQELADMLELHGHLLPPYEKLAYQAAAAHRLADDAKQEQFWQMSLDEAAGSQRVDALLEIQHLAIELGMLPESERALVAAIATGRGPLPPFSSLTVILESLVNQKKENELLQILQNYMIFEPGNPSVVSRYSFLAALRNLETPAKLKATMLKVAETLPDEPHVVATLASICLLSDRLEEASVAWKRLPIKPDELSSSYRACYVATELLAGRINMESPEITNFPWDALLPSERIRFKKLLKIEESADE